MGLRRIPPLALLTLMSCGPSANQLVERGQYSEACNALDYSYSRVLADRLAERSSATVTATVWSPADTYREAGVSALPTQHGPGWHVLVVDLVNPTGSPVAEIAIDGVAVRANGWQSRGTGLAFGEAYQGLTGTTYVPPKGLSLAEVGRAARLAITNPAERDQLVEAFRIGGGTVDPEGVLGAEQLAALTTPTCFAPPGHTCRAARVLVPAATTTAAPGLVIKLRYRVSDPNGALCDQQEQIAVPLAPGADLVAQLAATLPGPLPLSTVRARGSVIEVRAGSVGFEGDWSNVTVP